MATLPSSQPATPTRVGPSDGPRVHDELGAALPLLEPHALASTINLLGLYPDLDQVLAVLQRRSLHCPRAGARGVVAQLVYAAERELWRDQRELAERAASSKGTVGRVFMLLRAGGFLQSEDGDDHPSPRRIEAPCQRHRLRWTADTVDLAGEQLQLRGRVYAWLTTEAGMAPDDARAIARRKGSAGLAEAWAIHRHRMLAAAKTGQPVQVADRVTLNSAARRRRCSSLSNRGELRGVPASLRSAVPPDPRSGRSEPARTLATAIARPPSLQPRSSATASRGWGESPPALELRELALAVGDNAPRSTARLVERLASEVGSRPDFAVGLYAQAVSSVGADIREGRISARSPGALTMHRFTQLLAEAFAGQPPAHGNPEGRDGGGDEERRRARGEPARLAEAMGGTLERLGHFGAVRPRHVPSPDTVTSRDAVDTVHREYDELDAVVRNEIEETLSALYPVASRDRHRTTWRALVLQEAGRH